MIEIDIFSTLKEWCSMLSSGGELMAKRNPITYSGKVLDQRSNLTGPDDSGKAEYPKKPKNVSIRDNG